MLIDANGTAPFQGSFRAVYTARWISDKSIESFDYLGRLAEIPKNKPVSLKVSRGPTKREAKQKQPVVSAMLLLIDNYDSFTYNLVHYFGELGAEVAVHRNDALSVSEAMALQPDAIVLSPGPCAPDQAGICLELTKAAAATGTPLLGVCLGHQTIGQAFGGVVVPCHEIVHGKLGAMHHTGAGIFAGLPSPLSATRYHSLIVARDSLPDTLEVTAWLQDGTIMGLRHRTLPMEGVQFHPESIASEYGHAMLKTFLDRIPVPA